MRRVSSPRRPGPAGLVPALAGLALAAGCTHNHYYGATPAYVVPGETVIVDEVCELPTRVFANGSTLASRPAPSSGALASSSSASGALASAPIDTDVVASSRSSRVVISRPSTGPALGRGWNALGRGERLVTTEVQGGADASALR